MRHSRLVPILAICLLSSLAFASTGFAQTPPFDRTVIVGGSGTPAVNGANLLAAVAGITTASAANPWLIRVEPGIFDLQGASLVMKNFVDIEGSGRDVTYITSTVNGQPNGTVRVPAQVNTELRNLTVQNFGTTDGTAVRNESNFFLLTQVNLEVFAVFNSFGLSTVGSNPRVSEVFVRVISKEATATGVNIFGGSPVISETFVFIDSNGQNNTGFSIHGEASPTLLEVRAQLLRGDTNSFGIVVNASNATIQNCRVSVSSDDLANELRAIYALGKTNVTIKDCVASASGGNRPSGLWVTTGAVVDAHESSFTGTFGRTGSWGLFNANGGTTQLDRCTAEGQTQAVRNFSATDVAVIGASRLVGGVSAALGSTLSCAQSYNGANVELNANCL